MAVTPWIRWPGWPGGDRSGCRKRSMIMDRMRQSNKMKMGWVALFLVTLLLGVLIGKGWDRGVLATETYEELKTFTEVLTLVQKHYVAEVKTKDLVYGAIRRI